MTLGATMITRRAATTLMMGMYAVSAAGLSRADVTIEQQIAVDGFGPMKIGALEGKSTTAISGDRARSDSQTQFKSRFLRALAKGSGTGSMRIIRLDLERIDDIDTPKKQYTETTFQEMRDAAAQALQSAQSSKPSTAQQAPSGAPVDESQCNWSPARAEVKQTGEHASIAGADASRVTITVTQTCTDKTKGTRCDFVYLLDQWLTPDLPGQEETRTFWRNYARKLNLSGDLAATMQANAQQVFDRYKNGWGEAIKQAGSLKGYPVKSVLAMQVGGPQCKSESSSGGAGDSSQSGGENSQPSSTPTTGSDIAANLAKSLFSKLHKKDDSKPAADTAVAPGMVQLFQMSTETVAVRTDAIPSNMFDVPAGYTKVERSVTAP